MILHSAQHPTSSQLPRANDDVFLTGNKGKRNEKSDLSSWINRFFGRFINDEVNFSINTDDPIVLDNDLTSDYEMVMKMGLDKEHVIATVR